MYYTISILLSAQVSSLPTSALPRTEVHPGSSLFADAAASGASASVPKKGRLVNRSEWKGQHGSTWVNMG